jgi:hypothetical protein
MGPRFAGKQSVLAILLLVSSAASVMLACAGGGATTVRPASDVTVAVAAAKGGTITNDNGATLTIPANALSADAKVTVSDTGQTARPKGDALRNGSDTFRISAIASDGTSDVKLLSPATLSLTPSRDAAKNAQDLLVSVIDPTAPNLIHLHYGQGLRDGDGVKQSHLNYETASLASIISVIVIPHLGPQPTEGSVLQVPWYHQSGLPWCVPTSLTEMLRYYDLTPNVTDTLNGTFGSDLAFSNWEMAAKSSQPAGSGAGYGEMDNVNIPQIGDASGTGYVLYLWDDAMVTLESNSHGNFTDFETYVVLVDTGLFGLGERKPIALVVDNWWHSVVIVGVDGTGLFIHDSNGPIAEHFTWADFANAARGFRTDPNTGQTNDVHTIWTAVAYGYPIRPEQDRRGTVVIMRRDLTANAAAGNSVALEWDGASPHTHGYYFENATTNGVSTVGGDLGYALAAGSQLSYQYRIANVTNTALTYTSVAQISGGTFGTGMVTQSHTITVPPYTLSDPITGSLTIPSGVSQGFFDVKLFETDNANAVQDVKYIRFNVASPIIYIQPIR